MDEANKGTYEKNKKTVFKEFMKAKVSDPLILHPEHESAYAVYNVQIMTNSLSFTISHSLVRRRYSDFAWLRKRLCNIPCMCDPPSLPMKSHWWNFDSEFLQRRSKQLETFVVRVLKETLFLSCSALHLFLQSELTTKEMMECIKEGGVNEAVLASRCAVSSRHDRILSFCGNDFVKEHFTNVVWRVEYESLKRIENIHSSDGEDEITHEEDSQVKTIEDPYSLDRPDKLSSDNYSPWFEFWKILNEAREVPNSRN